MLVVCTLSTEELGGQYNRDAIAEAWNTVASTTASTAAAAARDGIGFMEWELAFR